MNGRRVASIVASLAFDVLLLLAFVVAFYAEGNRCGDSCRAKAGPGIRWHQLDDSWQWTGQLIVAGVALGVGIAATILLVRRSRPADLVLHASALALLGAWALFFALS
jgi:hypothetical protein